MDKIFCAALHSLGCKVNSYETEVIKENLKNKGFKIVDFSDSADVYVINTCTVTAIADKKSRQMIRRARKRNPKAIVVACGCFVEKDYEQISDECDIIIGNNKKTNVADEIALFFKNNKKIVKKDELFSINTAYEDMTLLESGDRTRAFIKIQDGCNAYCTYCLIPYVRGISRSRNSKEIIKEVRHLSERGHKEIVLCGINLSDYKYEEYSLCDIIEEINKISGIERIRMGSLEPDIYTKDFVKRISECEKVCKHFHLSLQSACNKTLEMMGRRYKTDSFFSACDLLREYFGNPAICADLIAGFPGESEKDFLETYENIEKQRLFELHVFPYSKREGTKAASMKGSLPKSLKHERAGKLIDLSNKMRIKYMKGLEGKPVSVLFEEEEIISTEKYYIGYSSEYIKCRLRSKEDLRGKVKSFLYFYEDLR